MTSDGDEMERHAKTLRAWQLALLRFAVTLENADRLAVLMIAAQMDALGAKHDGAPQFRFFRRTSAELCAAIQRPNEPIPGVVRQYIDRIGDGRLKRIFAAAVAIGQPESPAGKHVRRDKVLWRGLPSRRSGLP